jgi:hypothetical protein
LKATSSVSSSFALGISEATVAATGFDDMGTLLVGATLKLPSTSLYEMIVRCA